MKKHGITKAWHGCGCEKCGYTGYKGRTGIYEQFNVTPQIQQAISAGATVAELTKLARETSSFYTLTELGLRAVEAGETTYEEMLRVTGEA